MHLQGISKPLRFVSGSCRGVCCNSDRLAVPYPVTLLLLKGVFVSDRPDADAEIEGAPGAPLDVRCLDANKDYAIVSWKQPAVDGGNSILGYFVDR